MDAEEQPLILEQAELVCSDGYVKPYAPKEFEDSFIKNNYQRRTLHFKRTIFLGMFILGLFSIAEYFNIGEGANKILLLRVGIVTPMVIFAVYFFMKPKYAFWHDWLIASAVILIFILALPGRYQAYQQGLIYYYYSYLILVSYINIVVQPRFIPALISSMVICFGALLFFYWVGTEQGRLLFIAFDTFFFILLSLAANYFLQLNIRKNYGRTLLQKEASRREQLAKSELFELSNLDSLTKLNNRRFFDAQINKYDQKRTGVLFIDIDYFKLFNDSYGHIAGDEAIKKVADTLQTNARHGDLLARFGGEEFVMLMKSSDIDTVVTMANNIIQEIQQLNIAHAQSKFAVVTVSVGWSCLNQTGEIEACLESADKALYQAKSLGRNQVYPKKV